MAVFLFKDQFIHFQNKDVGRQIASGNGRIEATEIDIATQVPGRIARIMVDEGSYVYPGQTIAEMDSKSLRAQLEKAQAQTKQAEKAIATAKSNVKLRESIVTTINAIIDQRQAEFDAANKLYLRTRELAKRNLEAAEQLNTDEAAMMSAKAALVAARSLLPTTQSSIDAAKSQVTEAESALDAANAAINVVNADLDECAIRAPRAGRVQFRISQEGEVLPSGGKIVNLLDLSDVYMTFFLPAPQAGRVEIGAEVRLIFDAAPEYVVPAKVSYVASVAQFTPKTVETADERTKLMFKVKARIDPELLQKHLSQIKTGVPGLAYVRLDTTKPWPDELQIKLPK